MFDDVIINKTRVIERCINRINEEYQDNPANLEYITKQDSIILNLQRACEACIALAMHIVAEKGLGVPNYSREAFELLLEHNIIDKTMAASLRAMVGFRNIAVHDYQKLDIDIMQEIITNHLDDLNSFAKKILSLD